MVGRLSRLVELGLEEAGGASVLTGHERVGEGVAFCDTPVSDVESEVATDGGLEFFAGGQKRVRVPKRSKKKA